MSTNFAPDPNKPYYDSVNQILVEEDLNETDFETPYWRQKFRIRALTFRQQELINKNSMTKEGELDYSEWVFHTIAEGVVRPKINYQQAKLLADKNGESVRLLAEEIWTLGKIDPKVFKEYTEEIRALYEEREKDQKAK